MTKEQLVDTDYSWLEARVLAWLTVTTPDMEVANTPFGDYIVLPVSPRLTQVRVPGGSIKDCESPATGKRWAEEHWRKSVLECIAPGTLVANKFKMGDRVSKIKGAAWTGNVVGFYSTSLTPIGYAVESETELGSVQIYPEAALSPATFGNPTARIARALEVILSNIPLDQQTANTLRYQLASHRERTK